MAQDKDLAKAQKIYMKAIREREAPNDLLAALVILYEHERLKCRALAMLLEYPDLPEASVSYVPLEDPENLEEAESHEELGELVGGITAKRKIPPQTNNKGYPPLRRQIKNGECGHENTTLTSTKPAPIRENKTEETG